MSLREYVAGIVDVLVGRKIDLSRPYRAQVVTQHTDGSLDVKPYSAVVPPMTNVPICYGEPGVSVKVKAGAIVFVEFADGDPSLPHVTGWTAGSVDTLTLDADHISLGGERAIARRGDPVTVLVNVVAAKAIAALALAAGPSVPVSGYIMLGSKKVTGG